MVLMLSRKDAGVFDFSSQFVTPGTLAQKAPCQVGVDDACKKAKSIGESLACKHKKLVTCYASKRIPDGSDPRYITPTGQKDNCIGMVAYGSSSPFTNRTVFPICLGPGESIDFPSGHPYRYILRQNNNYLFKGLNEHEWFYGDKKSGYIIPQSKTSTSGHTEYTLPDGEKLPYGLVNTLTSLKRDFGYDVIPIYKYTDETLDQAYLPEIPMQISRPKSLQTGTICEEVLPEVCKSCSKVVGGVIVTIPKDACNKKDCLSQKEWDSRCDALKERSFGS